MVTSTTIDDGLPNAAGDITTGGGSGDKLANRSGGGTLVPAQDTSATPPADGAARCEEGSSIYSAFSAPCHLVVKFSFCRSAATGGNGPFPEKRLFDVEALGENTLQQVMGEGSTHFWADLRGASSISKSLIMVSICPVLLFSSPTLLVLGTCKCAQLSCETRSDCLIHAAFAAPRYLNSLRSFYATRFQVERLVLSYGAFW